MLFKSFYNPKESGYDLRKRKSSLNEELNYTDKSKSDYDGLTKSMMKDKKNHKKAT
jgi:hypothetical protein